jgi:hypothetical protein
MRAFAYCLFLVGFLTTCLFAIPPVFNYAGQVAVNGEAFEGNGLFKFALVNDNGTSSYWSNDGTSVDGSEPQSWISVTVNGGLYSVLLGNTAIQGMGAIDPQVFVENIDAKLRVWFSDGVNGFQQVNPDRPFASVPYAFSAGNAETASSAEIANGAVTKSMLSSEVINDLDRKITMNDLDPAVIADLNDSVTDGSIGLSKLSSEVSNALKPVVVGQPNSVVEVAGTSAYLSVDATGGNNSYQWKKNGVDITGATNHTLSITDLNASQHEGNYTVMVRNAFGSATSSVAQIDVNGSLTEGLVGWWKFDETDGTIAYDSSGIGNDGNLTNGPTWTEGKIGGALSFDGVDDYIDLGYSNIFHDVSECTVSIWLSVLSESSTWREIITLEAVQAIAIKNNGQFHLNIGNGSSWDGSGLYSNRTIGLNHWYALTICRDSNGAKLFIDGNLEDSSNLYVSSGTANHRTLIGAKDSSGIIHYTNGYFDDLRVYDRALSAFEVKALYELGEQPVQESGSGTTTVVNGTVADGSITTNQLSEQILKYLKPEITQQPTASTIFADTNGTISVSAEGKYLTYQWKKNGVNLTGETNATLTITDANATQHDGNYSVVVSNDFGSVESGEAGMDVWNVGDNVSNVSLWLDASNVGSFELSSSVIQNWRDLSGNGNDMNIPNGNPSLTGQLNGKTVAAYDGDDTTATTKNFSNDLDQSGYSIVTLSRYAGNQRERVISSSFGDRNWLLGHWGGKHSAFHAGSWVDSGFTADLNWHLFSVIHDPAISHNGGVAPLSSFWFDGSLRVTNSSGSFDDTPAPTDIVFGGYNTDENSICEVAEFILVGAVITDSGRQKIEGYLAQKWGLSDILPSTHPYKTSAP